MDPCPFVRLIVDSLALKVPVPTKRADSTVYPSTAPCFCVLQIKGFPSQKTVFLPFSSSSDSSVPELSVNSTVGFDLDPAVLRRLSGKSLILMVYVYNGRMGKTCGVRCGKLVGRVHIGIAFDDGKMETKPVVFHHGWTKLGHDHESDKCTPLLHLTVRTRPEPRFVFQFGGEPECSPVVFQIQGKNIRQPVFSCKFSADRNARSRIVPTDFTAKTNKRGGWLRTKCVGSRDKPRRERKGWMIIIHDLSGSPVAAASMTTPFVPSPGSDRVSRSNPGAWLILRPDGSSDCSWKPWGRLEAWRERGTVDALGYKFEFVTDLNGTRNQIVEGAVNMKKGGQFCIDNRFIKDSVLSSVKGFVMSSTVEGEGKTSKPMIQVGVQHVTCPADAALFVALSAAIDLCMDACRHFSKKLKKELCHDEQDTFS